MQLRSKASKDLQDLSIEELTKKSTRKIKETKKNKTTRKAKDKVSMADPNNLRNIPPVVDGENADAVWQREGQDNRGPLNDARAAGVSMNAVPGLQVPPHRITLGEQDAPHAYCRN